MSEALSTAEFKSLRDYFLKACGLYFADDKYGRVAQAVSNRMSVLDARSFADYFRILTSSPIARDELSILSNTLTVGETYFFRNADHWRAFGEVVLPDRIAANEADGYDRVRIWSAGCSTGEEAYTAAIVVRHLLGESADSNVEIIGTDISPKAVAVAKGAAYTENSFRGVPDAIRRDCFTTDGDGIYRPQSEIRELVTFAEVNLLDATATASIRDCDIIFCRNLLIYFGPTGIDEAMACFRHKLKPGGYLFLGHAEWNIGIAAGFSGVDVCNTFVFQAPPDPAAATAEPAIVSLPKLVPEVRSQSTSGGGLAAEAANDATDGDASSVLKDLRQQAIDKLCLQQHPAADQLFDQILCRAPDDLDSMLGRALIAAGDGSYDAAQQYCEQALALHPLSAAAYCVLGLIRENLGEHGLARLDLEKALFLDGQFAIAHFRLAYLHNRAGDCAAASRSFRNTLLTLAADTDQRVRLYSGGCSKKVVAQICRQYLGSDYEEPAPGINGGAGRKSAGVGI